MAFTLFCLLACLAASAASAQQNPNCDVTEAQYGGDCDDAPTTIVEPPAPEEDPAVDPSGVSIASDDGGIDGTPPNPGEAPAPASSVPAAPAPAASPTASATASAAASATASASAVASATASATASASASAPAEDESLPSTGGWLPPLSIVALLLVPAGLMFRKALRA